MRLHATLGQQRYLLVIVLTIFFYINRVIFPIWWRWMQQTVRFYRLTLFFLILLFKCVSDFCDAQYLGCVLFETYSNSVSNVLQFLISKSFYLFNIRHNMNAQHATILQYFNTITKRKHSFVCTNNFYTKVIIFIH